MPSASSTKSSHRLSNLDAAPVSLRAAANAEALRAPLGYTAAIPIPDAYDILARERRAVIVEFPFPAPLRFHLNTEYMLASTHYWHPLVNGYSGFVPASYVKTWNLVNGFPNNSALRALRDIGVTHVVVHYESPTPIVETLLRMPLPPALERMVETPALGIYRLRWERIPDWP